MKKNETMEVMNVPATTESAVPVLTNDNGNLFVNDASRKQSFCSFVPTTIEEKKNFFNMINSPSKQLKSMINLSIRVKDIYAETCEYINKETGEVTPGVRIVLIDDKGESYSTASTGIMNCMSKVFQIFGYPNQWDGPIEIKIKEIEKSKTQRVLLFDIV